MNCYLMPINDHRIDEWPLNAGGRHIGGGRGWAGAGVGILFARVGTGIVIEFE